jgi:type IV secretion system protein VirB8
MSVVALMGLAPFKTVVPYVIRVDNSSGYVDVIKPLANDSESADIKENKRNIVSYIMSRESYNWASQPANYEFIKLLSYDDVFQEYKNFQLSSKGYVAMMGKVTQFKTEVNSIVPLSHSNDPAFSNSKDIQTYQVRFTKILLDSNGRPVIDSVPTHWVTSISFDYKNPAKNEGDDWLNPRGFGVRAYSKSQEVNGG